MNELEKITKSRKAVNFFKLKLYWILTLDEIYPDGDELAKLLD
jgi:hypothetical protein